MAAFNVLVNLLVFTYMIANRIQVQNSNILLQAMSTLIFMVSSLTFLSIFDYKNDIAAFIVNV